MAEEPENKITVKYGEVELDFYTEEDTTLRDLEVFIKHSFNVPVEFQCLYTENGPIEFQTLMSLGLKGRQRINVYKDKKSENRGSRKSGKRDSEKSEKDEKKEGENKNKNVLILVYMNAEEKFERLRFPYDEENTLRDLEVFIKDNFKIPLHKQHLHVDNSIIEYMLLSKVVKNLSTVTIIAIASGQYEVFYLENGVQHEWQESSTEISKKSINYLKNNLPGGPYSSVNILNFQGTTPLYLFGSPIRYNGTTSGYPVPTTKIKNIYTGPIYSQIFVKWYFT